ncbi:MAG TPA: T9SS type A sorting domain-containing protein, partial [Bacteroidia bacterium]|nr:T9SS type A sorting domain-containing protein [Bacteroidia bacterium]
VGRRAGFHFFCDNPDSSNRNNSYFVWFRVDNSTMQIYKVTNNVFGSPVYQSTVTINPNQSYDYKVIYDRISGLIRVYQNNNLIGSWTDSNPLSNGGYISFRSGNATLTVDQLDVYRSRLTTANITVGSGNANDIRYQNPDPLTPSAKIKSICSDSATNLSAIDYDNINVDWTPPLAIDSIRDGLGADINITSPKTILSANWTPSTDVNSGIAKYWYCIGTTPGDSNTVAWTANMDSLNVTQTGLNLTQGQWYYFSVRAQDGAGLYSTKILSDGQKVDTTFATGINQFKIENLSFKVYPNPTQNLVSVDYTLEQEATIKWQITDLIGQTVLQTETVNSMGTYTQKLDLTTLSQGLYLLNLTINGQQKTIKLIKQGN